MRRTDPACQSADTAVLLHGEEAAVQRIHMGRKAGAPCIDHAAGSNGIAEEHPAVLHAVCSTVNIKIQADILILCFCDTDADPVAACHIHDMLPCAERVAFHSFRSFPAV